MAITKKQWKAIYDWLWWNHNAQSNRVYFYFGPEKRGFSIYKFLPDSIIWQHKQLSPDFVIKPEYKEMDHTTFKQLKHVTENFEIVKGKKTKRSEFQKYLG